MSKKHYSGLLTTICIVCSMLPQCMIDDVAGGSGAETGNAKFAGLITDTNNKPVGNVEVFLYASEYNPVVDTPPDYPSIDTTDSSGNYYFDIKSSGTYSILAKRSSTHEYGTIRDITVDGEDFPVTNITLSKTGSIRVNFPPDIKMKPGYIYIPGTSIVNKINNSHISARFLMIDSIPEGLYSSLKFVSLNRDYVTKLARLISVKSDSTTVVEVCMCAQSAEGYDAHPLSPVRTQYAGMNGASLTRNVWAGEYVAILTESRNLNPCVIRRMVTVFDSAYLFNKKFLGHTPTIDKHYTGLLTITESPNMDGIHNGLIGATGVELGADRFEEFYNLVATKNTFPQELFFVFASNFNWYMNKMTHSSNAKYSVAVARGFSLYMRFITMENIDVKAATFNNLTLAQYHLKIESLMDLYLADTAYQFGNSFATDTLPFATYKSEHLFASLLMLLGKLNGPLFSENIWKEIDKRPVATTTQVAIDNLVIASSITAGKNLTNHFITWKFPVSDKAKTEAAGLFP